MNKSKLKSNFISGAEDGAVITIHFKGDLPYFNLRHSVWCALDCSTENEHKGKIERTVLGIEKESCISLVGNLKRLIPKQTKL